MYQDSPKYFLMKLHVYSKTWRVFRLFISYHRLNLIKKDQNMPILF